MNNVETIATIDLVNKLTRVDKRITQVECELDMLTKEHNQIVLELQKRVPTLEKEEEFKVKKLDRR